MILPSSSSAPRLGVFWPWSWSQIVEKSTLILTLHSQTRLCHHRVVTCYYSYPNRYVLFQLTKVSVSLNPLCTLLPGFWCLQWKYPSSNLPSSREFQYPHFGGVFRIEPIFFLQKVSFYQGCGFSMQCNSSSSTVAIIHSTIFRNTQI